MRKYAVDTPVKEVCGMEHVPLKNQALENLNDIGQRQDFQHTINNHVENVINPFTVCSYIFANSVHITLSNNGWMHAEEIFQTTSKAYVSDTTSSTTRNSTDPNQHIFQTNSTYELRSGVLPPVLNT